MRNTIVIATSNAGSKSIIQAVQAGRKLSELQEPIVDSIIKDGIYRPELINRFDGVIIFEPLNQEEQKVVAGYLTNELQERMRQKGYSLVLSDDLITEVAKRGYNPQFGARPMRRVIQDEIEEMVARKIIAGSLKKGDTITITATDLASQ